MRIFGSQVKIIYNRIDSSAYDGLYAGKGDTSGREIAYNYITDCCLSLADGGGIYTYGHSSSTQQDIFHHNIVVNAWGYLGGCAAATTQCSPLPEPCRGAAYGIYVDEQANHRVLEHNTVINGGEAGVFFHWTQDNRLAHNTLFGSAGYQVVLSGRNDPRFVLQGNDVEANLLIAAEPNQRTFKLMVDYGSLDFGDSNDNTFYHPAGERHMTVCRGYGEDQCTSYSLAEWVGLSGKDSRSKDLSSLAGLQGSQARPVCFINPSLETLSIDVSQSAYLDVSGKPVTGTAILDPFESLVLWAPVGAPAPGGY